MKKGFTLIELLGAIIILSLLMILALPRIINSVKSSTRGVDELTKELIYNAADLYIPNHKEFIKVDGNKYKITLRELVNDGLLKSPVRLAKNDTDITDSMCVEATYNNGYTYELKDNCEENKNPCQLINGEKGTMGSKYECYVNDDTIYNFYLLSDNEDGTANLIMDRNICEDGIPADKDHNCDYEWNVNGTNDHGPFHAMIVLASATESWNNVSNMNLEYNDIADNTSSGYTGSTTYGYTGITIEDGYGYITLKDGVTLDQIVLSNDPPLKARIPKLKEVADAGCHIYISDVDFGTCPDWLVDNLTYYDVSGFSGSGNTDKYRDKNYSNGITNINTYWLLASDPNSSDSARRLVYYGFAYNSEISQSAVGGIRPVITVNLN